MGWFVLFVLLLIAHIAMGAAVIVTGAWWAFSTFATRPMVRPVPYIDPLLVWTELYRIPIHVSGTLFFLASYVVGTIWQRHWDRRAKAREQAEWDYYSEMRDD